MQSTPKGLKRRLGAVAIRVRRAALRAFRWPEPGPRRRIRQGPCVASGRTATALARCKGVSPQPGARWQSRLLRSPLDSHVGGGGGLPPNPLRPCPPLHRC